MGAVAEDGNGPDRMMMEREPSTSEIAEDLREIRAGIDRLIDTVERTYVRLDVYRAEQASLELRVGRVEERNQWLARVAVSGLALPILVAVILGLIVAGGFS